MERISPGCGRREFSCKRVEYQVVASPWLVHGDERPHAITISEFLRLEVARSRLARFAFL
jgi:hypothetical protein